MANQTANLAHKNDDHLQVIFTETYAEQKIKMNKSEVEKLEQAIEVHGYRGASKFKHNGVVNLKPTDTQLIKCLERFKADEKNKPTIVKIQELKLEFVINIK